MKLMKLAGSNTEHYQWWVITTLMLQARSALLAAPQPPPALQEQRPDALPAPAATPAVDPTKLLQLAEGMAQRVVGKEKRLESFEALLLWVDLHLAMGKPQAAAAALSSPEGSTAQGAMAEEKAMFSADLAMAGGDVAGAAETLKAQLLDNPDNWSALQAYLDAVVPASRAPGWHPGRSSALAWLSGGTAEAVELAAGAAAEAATEGAGAQGDAQAGLEQARQLVSQLVERVGPVKRAGQGQQGAGEGAAAAPHLTMRGPHLARVEIAWRGVQVLARQGAPAPASEAAQQLLATEVVGYYREAGHLPSCAADLRPYVKHLQGPAAAWLAGEMEVAAGLGEGAEGGGEAGTNGGAQAGEGVRAVDACRVRVCALQVLDDLGLPALGSEGEAVAHAVKLMRLFVSMLPLYKVGRGMWIRGLVRRWIGLGVVGLGAPAGAHAAALPPLTLPTLHLLCHTHTICHPPATSSTYAHTCAPAHVPTRLHTHAHTHSLTHSLAHPPTQGLDERERGPADELPPLAAAALVTAASHAPAPAAAAHHLVHAALVLEAACATRPYSAAVRLPLAALYSLLGCPEGVHTHVRACDIKNVQFDTVGCTHLLPGLLAFEVSAPEGSGGHGVPAATSQPLLRRLLRQTLTLFEDHAKDAGETLFTALKSGTYSKVGGWVGAVQGVMHGGGWRHMRMVIQVWGHTGERCERCDWARGQ